MISDESLMLEFQRGSRAAFEELYARYREPLYDSSGAGWLWRNLRRTDEK
jgi:hypothetical protein